MVKTALRRLLARIPGVASGPRARCLRLDVRAEHEVRAAARQLAHAGAADSSVFEPLLRELVSLNTPALFLNIVQPGARVRIMLSPWEGRSVRFRGQHFFVDAGSESVEGIEAFVNTPFSHVTALFPTTPDHPVYVISIEHQGPHVYLGEVPSYLTNVTIVANGRVVTRAERLLHERGLHVWAA